MGKDSKGHGSNARGGVAAQGRVMNSKGKYVDVVVPTNDKRSPHGGDPVPSKAINARGDTFTPYKMSAKEKRDAEAGARNIAAAKAIMADKKAMAAERAKPKAKLFSNSTKTARETEKVARADPKMQPGSPERKKAGWDD